MMMSCSKAGDMVLHLGAEGRKINETMSLSESRQRGRTGERKTSHSKSNRMKK